MITDYKNKDEEIGICLLKMSWVTVSSQETTSTHKQH